MIVLHGTLNYLAHVLGAIGQAILVGNFQQAHYLIDQFLIPKLAIGYQQTNSCHIFHNISYL